MTDNSFRFWCNWLLVVSVIYVFAGFVIALFPDSLLLALHKEATGLVFFGGVMPEDAAQMRRFLFGPLGGTISGYFLLQFFIVRGPFRRMEPWAWRAVFLALIVWFVIDGAVSARHGAWFNIWMVNLWTLFLAGLPLAMTWKFFRMKELHPDAYREGRTGR